VRCPRCGNDNFDGNRFCGMCGATLIKNQPSVVPSPPPPAPSQAERRPEPSSPRRAAPAAPPEEPSPAITGPSFLGLNKSDGRGQRSGGGDELRIGSYGRGAADYLLDDDDEPECRSGKWLIILVALVLAGGFAYVRWKQGGFDWVTGGSRPATQNSQSATDSGSAPSSPTSSDAAPAPSATAPSSTNTPAAANSTPTTPPTDTANANTPLTQSAPAANPAPNADGGATADSVAPTPAPANSDQSSAEKAAPSNSDGADTEPAPAPAKPAASIPKPRKPTPVIPADNIAEAERYIYGNGVRQDCDRGMRLLKSGAETNPKAMVSMGGLYSTGTCAPRDLPTAYRWFALALHKQPDNQVLQDDLQKLWGQMTPPERQLAIKLSQ
jgi:hypothetical protein